MKVLVCGSREWADYATVRRRLEKLPAGSLVIHGAARGADLMAGTAARAIGLEERAYPADWKGKGKRAGIIRNLEMLEAWPDLVLAFWDGSSPGTGHTIREARKRGIEVEIVSYPR